MEVIATEYFNKEAMQNVNCKKITIINGYGR